MNKDIYYCDFHKCKRNKRCRRYIEYIPNKEFTHIWLLDNSLKNCVIQNYKIFLKRK